MKKLLSTNNPYYDLYAPNAPENANIAGFGDWFSFLRRGNTEQYNDNGMSDIGNNNTNYLNGNSGIRYDQMGSLGQQQQQFDFDVNQGNPYTSQMMQTGQPAGEVLDNSAINERKQIEGQQQKQDGNNNGGNSPNWGGVIAAAGTNTINAIRNGGSKAEIAAGIMGIPSFAKMWTYDDATEKKRMNEIKDLVSSSPENKTWITDSSSSGGAFNGIKLNTQQTPNLINTSKIKNFNDWRDFSAYHKGKFGKNLGTAMIEGTMSGSVGGPWGMLGGAVTGLFGSLFGRIGAKKRAQRAQNIANSRVNDYRLYYNAENFRRQAEYDLANKNLLNNGLKQQNISEMSNFKAYGGNLYPDGGNLDDDYVYEGGILPEVSIIEEAMPWYEKWYNKGKRALGRGWENVKKAMATPTMTALPGQSPTFQGQFFPTMPSTVGDDLEYALSIVSAPWDMEGIGQAAWVLKHPKEAAKLMKQPVDKLVDWAKRKTNKEYQSIANRANSTEDALALTKDRLRNGGFDRLENAYNSRAGKSNKLVDDTDSWVSDNSAINLEYGNRINKNNFDYIKDIYSDMNPEANWAVNVPYSKNRLYSNTDPLWINHNVRNNIDELHYPNELRQQLLDLDVMEIPSSLWGRGVTGENVGVASYGKTPAIFTDRPAKYANNSAKNQLSAHEYAHTVYYPDELPKNVFNPKSKYLKSANGAELNARGTQIKNYFGLKEGEPLTAEHLKYAKNHMTKDLGYDNNMTEFFESIKDYKRAAKWLNEHSPAIGGITTGIGVLTNLDDEQNINAMGGNLYPDGGTIKEGNEEVVQKPVYEGGELPEIEVIGYEYPAYEPTNSWNYPETADPESVEWLANWLDKRRPQLYNNLQNILYSNYLKEIAATRYIPKREKEYDFYTFVPKNKEVDGYGITKEEDFDRGLLFNETPFHGSLSTWFNDKFGDGSYRKNDIDIIYNNQIHNAASATEGGQNTMYQGTTILGDYAPARGINSWDENSRTHTVSYNPDFYKPIWDNEEPYSRIKKSVRLHERTHASNAIPQEETISKIMENAKDRDGNPIKKDKYLDKDTEIYSRLMEERYRHNLNPTKTITKKDLEQMREESKNDSPLENHNILNRYDDETLLRLFNEVAKGNNDTKKYSNVAAMGGNLYTDLSPNMMNLWNDKQNIDKQKVMNQQMNFGLGNSFNQKLNTFNYGGNLFGGGGVIFNGRLFKQRDDGNYVKYNDPEFVVTKEDMEKALREGLAFIDSGIINWKGRLFERGNDNNYHAVDDPEYTLERYNVEELIKNGEAKNVNSVDIIASKTNKNNIISTPEDLHRAFYGNDNDTIANKNKKELNNNKVVSDSNTTITSDTGAIFHQNSDGSWSDETGKINISDDEIKEQVRLGNGTVNNSNNTTSRRNNSDMTKSQKEYYNKKRQSYAEFNKDMGFLNKDDVKRFQEAYNREHEDKLKVDGLTGDKTIKAYQRWVNELNKDNKDKEALKIDGFYGKKSKSANNSDVANRMLNNEDFDINMLNNATVSTNEEPIEESVREPNIYEQEKYEDLYGNDYDNIDQNKQNYYNNYPYAYGGNLNRFDYGGAMNGMDLPTDMQYYENGGTHEENPNGGIQVGVDPQGNPNLVEEGEFRYGDKVLSDRLNVNPDILSLFNAPKSKGNKTYAEVGKKLADKAKDGLNDPITKRTLDANMGRLFNSQEYQKKEAELDAQKDQQLAEYKNTLESPTQGNPMYGSMKYSGMGNANQGLNAGADEGMSNPMDSSDLSNVNRSGNAMMAAYGGMFANGGNLYPYGGYSRTPEDDAQLSFIRPLFNIDNYQNDWTNNNSGNLVRQGSVYDPYDLSVNTNPNLGLNPYKQRYTDEYVDAISKGDPKVRQQILQDEGLYDGKIDGIWGKKSKAAWDEFNRIRKIRDIYDTTQNAQPQQTTTTQTTTTQTNTPTQTTTPTNTSNSNSKSVYVKEKSSGSDVNSALNQAMNLGDKTGDVVTNNTANSGIGRINPVEKNGEYGRLEAQPYGLANPNVPWLSEAGKYANLAKYTMPFMTDQKNLTNWKYNINPAPANRLQAKGESSYANRTAEHLGDYVAPNLMDIERLNNATMAQTTAQQRGTNNISGGNRGFANSQNAAIGFNGQVATGQNYATTNEYNANQKMTAANFNRDTNKFNVDADNEMHKDNLNSWLQGRNMDLNAHIAANQERLNERQYKDRVDRDAALNRQDNLNAMFNNQMNFIADEAKRRRELNEFNTLKNNRFYYDPRSGWNQKDDNGFNFEIADRLQSKGLYGFTGERDTAYKNLLKEKNGANFDKNDWKYIDKLIQMESDAKAHEQELVDAKKLEDRNNNLTEIQDIVSALNNTRDFHAWDSQRDYYNGLDYGDMSDEQVKRQLDFLRSIRNNYFNPQYWSNQSKTES